MERKRRLRNFSKFLLTLIMVLVCAGMARAATTGSLVGKVVDEGGTALPGVTIMVTSPALQGQKSTTTDASGKYRLILLPPGEYELTASLPGFQTQTMKGIRVNLDVTYTVDLTMKAAKLEESIVVTAEQPLIDTTTTTVGENYTSDYVEQIPTARSYLSVMNLTPGVTGSDGTSGGMIVNGASGTESNYIIDGMNTTDIEVGTQGKGLNFDFVEEVQVKTGGYEAEFGRATGAVVNVITKSGGNEFHGSVFYYWRNPSYSATEKATYLGTDFLGTKEYDYGVSLGGPIIKDKFWFFLAYNPSVNEYLYSTNETFKKYRGESRVLDRVERDYWALKLTYNVNENNTITFSTFGDPTTTYNRDQTGTRDRDRMTDTGGTDWTLKWDSILSDNLVLTAQYGQHNQVREDESLNGNDLPRIYNYSDTTIGDRGGLGYMEDLDLGRDMFRVSLEWFWGNHDIKGGFDYEDNTFDSKRRYSGDVRYTHYGYYGGGAYQYYWRRVLVQPDPNGSIEIYPSYYGTVPEWLVGTRFSPVQGWLETDTSTENTSYFIQDKWNITEDFMLSVGFRVEEQKMKGEHPYYGGQYTAVDITDNYSPRVGFTWDIFGDGSSKLYGSFGRFYESIPMDINNRAFGNEIMLEDYWFAPSQGDTNGDGVLDFWDWNPENNDWSYTPENLAYLDDQWVGGFRPAPVMNDLKGSSHDQLILGYDQLLNDLWSVGVKFTYNSLNEVVEDLSFDKGVTYIIGNPGNDISFLAPNPLEFTDAQGVYHFFAEGDMITLTPEMMGFPVPKRNYRAYELTLRRKFADGWQMNMSIVRSKLWGNYIGGVLPYYGQTDPNLTAAYDLPSTLVNTGGLLPFDRTWQVKWDGLYSFDWGATVGWQYTYYSGTPIAAYGRPPSGYYGEFRYLQNGALGLGRTDPIQSLDLNLSYTYDLGTYGSVTGYFYVFNVFNFQNVTEYNQRLTYDRPSQAYIDENFGGDWDNWVRWIDGRFANLDEAEAYLAEQGMEVYDHFLEPVDYQTPRYIRFGIKYKF